MTGTPDTERSPVDAMVAAKMRSRFRPRPERRHPWCKIRRRPKDSVRPPTDNMRCGVSAIADLERPSRREGALYCQAPAKRQEGQFVLESEA